MTLCGGKRLGKTTATKLWLRQRLKYGKPVYSYNWRMRTWQRVVVAQLP